MNKEVADLVTHFIGQNCKRSKSIILVGSHALGEARNESDLDFLVIAQDVESVGQVKNSIAMLQSASPNTFIDCKVYTEKGLADAKSGRENLFLWTALSNGRLLCGEDIRESVKLNPMLVTELIWQMIEDLENSRDLLRIKSQFTGSCYSIYYSLVTAYFLERFVFQSSESFKLKIEFMQERLLSTYDIVKESYQWVVHNVPTSEISCRIKIPMAVDKKYSGTRYMEILEICENTLEYLKNVYSCVTKWREQLL
ncbi:MAG: nucleotidyltransferase domain-containing protein [Promethearchaeota archaeon]